MKKCGIILMAMLLVLAPIFGAAPAYAAEPPPFQLESQAAYMVNLDTGQVIVDVASEELMFPGYLAKIMTALVVLDNVEDLDNETATLKLYIQDMVYGSANLADIYNGNELSVRDLLYAMMLQSANEATLMLADYVGDGSIGHFVDLMNEKAAELGCTNTHFTDPAGFADQDTYSTARDLSLIAAEAMKNPDFVEIVNTTAKTIKVVNKDRSINLNNYTNGLIRQNGDYYMASASGVMSSSLAESGRCMVSQATSGGYTYQLVVLGAPVTRADGSPTEPANLHYYESRQLYRWAFENFVVRTVVDRGELVAECPVRYSMAGDIVRLETGAKFTSLMEKSLEMSSVIYETVLPEYIAAPVEKGQQVGELRLVLAEEVLGTVPLLATENLPQSKFLTAIGWIGNILHTFPAKFLLVFVITLMLGFGWLFLANRERKRRNERRRVNRQRRGGGDYHL